MSRDIELNGGEITLVRIVGYIRASEVNVRTMKDRDRSLLRVNPSYSRDSQRAVNPSTGLGERRARRDRRG